MKKHLPFSILAGWGVISLLVACTKGSDTDQLPEGENDPKIPYLYWHWMMDIDDCYYLSEITIPGTHDSGADLHTSQCADPGDVICQHFRLSNQMDMGVRCFDIRLCYDDGSLLAYHGGYYLHKNFTDQLNNAVDWLGKHPSETLIFIIKQEHSSENDHTFGQKVYDYLKKKGLNHFYLKNEMPTLGEVRGKIVIARRFGNKLGCDFGLSLGWSDNTKGAAFCNSGLDIYVQDHYSLHTVSTNTKVSEIKDCIVKANEDLDPKRLYINFTSGERVPLETICETADDINYELEDYLDEKSTNNWTRCGIVMVNFAGGYYDQNNNSYCSPNLVKKILFMNF